MLRKKVYICLECSEAKKKECYYNGFQSVVLIPPISETSRNFLEKQSFRPHPRPPESETLGEALNHLCFIKPSEDSEPNLSVRTTSLF